MRQGILWSLAFAMMACAPSGELDEFAVRDSAGLVIAENDLGSFSQRCVADTLPETRIGGVEDDDDQFLYRVMGVTRLDDGRIVVVNQGTQEVRWYGPDGALLGRAGREGQGPGEFTDAFLIQSMPGDTVWVGDYSPWQWHVFGPDMKFHRTVRLHPTEVNSPRISAIMDDGQQIFSTSGREWRRGNFEMDSVALERFGADGALRDTVLVIPTGRWGQMDPSPGSIWLQPWFEASAEAEGRGSTFVVASWNRPELFVYRLNDGFTPERIIRWTAADRSISPGEVEAEREKLANRYPDLDPQMKAMLLDPMLDPDRPVAESHPAVASLVVGRDGRIWVRSHSRAADSTATWTAFSAEGRAECRMDLPRFSVSEFGSDYLMTHREDAQGMEVVEVYRFR
ncbi:MAG TPA: hypothetical protein PLL69_02030 [Gemmatimonadales bacterium]|nr:hypothetical protein [Gemmatimonadales bacterium]